MTEQGCAVESSQHYTQAWVSGFPVHLDPENPGGNFRIILELSGRIRMKCSGFSPSFPDQAGILRAVTRIRMKRRFGWPCLVLHARCICSHDYG